MASNPPDPIAELDDLIARLKTIPYRDLGAIETWKLRANMILGQLVGQDNPYRANLWAVRFEPSYLAIDERANPSAWEEGMREALANLETLKEQLTRFPPQAAIESHPIKAVGNSVFIVHGHDQGMKLAVARVIEGLGFKPIVLHEQPDKGRTLIEKLEDYSDVGFAVVLLSADDMGYERIESAKDERPRARQNVVFELGYFIGRLGRGNVVALHPADAKFELPSDFSGVLFKPYDPAGAWKLGLVKELKAAGYPADANRIV